jgi:hypothetical protein
MYSFLFYSGVLTLSPQSAIVGEDPPESFDLVVANEINRLDFVSRLVHRLELAQTLWRKFQIEKSASSLQSMLHQVVDKQQTIFDNFFSEGALQSTLEASFRASRVAVEAEFPVQDDKKNSERSDLIFTTDEDVKAIIDLKCLRLNCIQPQADPLLTEIPERWYPADFKHVQRNDYEHQ